MKQEKWITGIICVLVILGAGVLYLHHGQKNTGSDTVFATEISSEPAVTGTTSDGSHSLSTDSQQEVQTEYAVYICGAVKHPGVYRFKQTARVCDVVEAAGGFTKNAATTSINQARYITDGEQIEILTRKQLLQSNKIQSNGQKGQEQISGNSSSGNNQNTVQDSGKINLNTATETELMALSGVGQSKAKAIIDYRTQNGLFGSIEDIMQVPGIKEGVFNQIKDSITV